MSTFDEVQFPTAISLKSSGGPQRQTQIVSMGSGYESRNARWSSSRRTYNVGYGLKALSDIYTVVSFFEARNGRLAGFRFKDWADYKSGDPSSTVTSTDQNIGTGDGATAIFQLRKGYTSGGSTAYRDIKKPVTGTTKIALNGSPQLTGWSVSTTTGLVTFVSPPAGGVAITAGFEFDVPCRFDSDQITINLEQWHIGDIQNINVIEIFI